jgi:hypothetical protein
MASPALHDVGGSLCKSFNSLRILLEAIKTGPILMTDSRALLETSSYKLDRQTHNNKSPKMMMDDLQFNPVNPLLLLLLLLLLRLQSSSTN